MTTRVSPGECLELIPSLASGGVAVDFGPFIVTAGIIVDDLLVYASQKLVTVTPERAAQIEKYLAVHFAALFHGVAPISSTQVGAATEKYHDIYEPGLRASTWGQTAMLLDPSGYLAKMADRVERPNLKDAQFEVI